MALGLFLEALSYYLTYIMGTGRTGCKYLDRQSASKCLKIIAHVPLIFRFGYFGGPGRLGGDSR